MISRALSLVLVAVLLVSAVCFLSSSVKAINFLSNGDFEDGTWTTADWPLYWHYGKISTDAYEGNQAINLTSSPYKAYQNYSGSFQPNTYYNLSFAFQTTSWIDIAPFINWASSGDDVFNQQYLRRYTNGTWINLFSGSFSVLSEYSVGDWNITVLSIQTTPYMYNEYVHFQINNPLQGYLCIDDIVFSSGFLEIGGLTLNSPSNLVTLTDLNVTFSYTPILSLAIQNASLWLNSYATWQRVANTTTVTNGTLNNFTYALPYQGVYLWNIEVWDSSNYFFAPANYTLTVASQGIDYGLWYDPCEEEHHWNDYGFTGNVTVDSSDYEEGSGSMRLGYSSQYNATIPISNTGLVIGFFMKFEHYANCTLQEFYLINEAAQYRGFTVQTTMTHFRIRGISYSTPIYSDWQLYSGDWTWIEVQWNVTPGDPNVYGLHAWANGVLIYDVGTPYCPLNLWFWGATIYNNTGYWKIDFIRYADHEEYPVFVTSTITVSSNPELNAYFSMATNSSSLQTETLCVNGYVNENQGLDHVGASPYLDSQDDNTSYVQTNLAQATFDQYYTFNQTTLLTISSVTLHVRLACFPISGVVAVLAQVYFWNGTEYIAIEGYQRYGDWLTMNSSTLFTKSFNTPAMLNQMRLKLWMNLNQQVPGMTYFGRCTAIWIDVQGYGAPKGSAIHQTPYNFNPISTTYVFTALNTTAYDASGNEYSFTGFNYSTGSYVGATLILTSLSGITSIVLEYSIVVPSDVFLVPFMFLFWVIGLFCLFLCPIYAIDKIKKREYSVGLVGGVILFAIGFGLFIGGLWGITI